MKRLLLLIALFLGISTMSFGGACSSGTLADYTAAGFSCTIGDKLFSNFSYVATAGGSAVPIPASGVAVVPEMSGSEEGFLFSAGWNVGPGNSLDSLITYTVTATTGSIVDAVLSMGGFGFANDGVVSVAETMTNGVNLFVFSSGSGTVSSASATFAGVSSLTVTKDIAVNGHSTGTAAVSAVFNMFSQTVPEPASMLLLGSGLVGLAGFIGRRRKNTRA